MLMKRLTTPAGLCALCFALSACSTARTYTATDPKLDDEPVTATVQIDEEQEALEATIEAGQTPVRAVSLRTGDGQTIPASFSRYGPAEKRGGIRLGVGTGTAVGGGNVGVGVGASKQVGGRVVPGPLFARWLDAPLQVKPLTLVVHLESNPSLVIDIPLGEVLDSEKLRDPVLLQQGFTQVQEWRMPDGSKQTFYVRRSVGGTPLYKAQPEEQ
jgi:hypothetical protein